MVLVWAGYGTSLFGWCLFRDYDVTFGQLLNPVHPYSGPWPPPPIPAGQLWPTSAGQAQQANPGLPAAGALIASGVANLTRKPRP